MFEFSHSLAGESSTVDIYFVGKRGNLYKGSIFPKLCNSFAPVSTVLFINIRIKKT